MSVSMSAEEEPIKVGVKIIVHERLIGMHVDGT